jgi:hypothetical protein
VFPVHFRGLLRKKLKKLVEGESYKIHLYFDLKSRLLKKEPKNVSLITNFHKLFNGFKVKVTSRYIFVRLQIAIDVTSRFQEYLHHLGCPNRETQESILPNFDFFIFPIFAFKLGHFKVQTLFSYVTNTQA